MKLSIVSTLYQSAPYIQEFCKQASSIARQIAGEDYEIILVNDGSPDQSLDIAVSLTKQNHHLSVIDLSRNFGHHKAMMTGLSRAQGELIFLIDSDLEEDPSCLLSFATHMKKENCDVVYGVQEQRKGDSFERWTGEWFYFLFNKITKLALPKNVLTARLMTRSYVNALLLHREREVFIAGLWHITGFNQKPLLMHKKSNSATTYTFQEKMSLLINSITSFSNAPLVSIFYIGISLFFISVIYLGYLLVNWMFLAKPLSGWTSVMASIWLLGSMMISFMGIIGIYLSKIFSETKQRPYTIIKNIYDHK